MHNTESVQENEKYKLLWDFEIQTNPVISARLPDQVIVKKEKKKKKKRTWGIVEFAVPADHGVKLKERDKRDTYPNLSKELKKTMGHESDGDPNCKWRARYSHQKIGKKTGGIRNKRTSGDHPHYNII